MFPSSGEKGKDPTQLELLDTDSLHLSRTLSLAKFCIDILSPIHATCPVHRNITALAVTLQTVTYHYNHDCTLYKVEN
jgi:hypothetical protein